MCVEEQRHATVLGRFASVALKTLPAGGSVALQMPFGQDWCRTQSENFHQTFNPGSTAKAAPQKLEPGQRQNEGRAQGKIKRITETVMNSKYENHLSLL